MTLSAAELIEIEHKRQERTKDIINHPAHYTNGKIECIDAIESATANLTGFKGYCAGNAIKYLWRWHSKGGTEDLRKAAWYIGRLIKYIEKQ